MKKPHICKVSMFPNACNDYESLQRRVEELGEDKSHYRDYAQQIELFHRDYTCSIGFNEQGKSFNCVPCKFTLLPPDYFGADIDPNDNGCSSFILHQPHQPNNS